MVLQLFLEAVIQVVGLEDVQARLCGHLLSASKGVIPHVLSVERLPGGPCAKFGNCSHRQNAQDFVGEP